MICFGHEQHSGHRCNADNYDGCLFHPTADFVGRKNQRRYTNRIACEKFFGKPILFFLRVDSLFVRRSVVLPSLADRDV